MRPTYSFIITFMLIILLTVPISAQENQTTVPDITGLNVPQAVATLNQAGLRMGVQTPRGWTSEATFPQNTISEQSVESGTTVDFSTVIDVTVLRSPNVALLYDDNDLTLVNLTDRQVALTGVTFNSIEGTPASFPASRWANSLRERQCTQIWSVGRNGPKGLDDCSTIQTWLSTINTAEHFWIGNNGVVRFNILENGIERGVCSSAPANSQDQPLRCEVYLAGGGTAEDTTPFIYFTYTPSAFAIINITDDQWMPTNQSTLYNYNPNIDVQGSPLNVGDAELYRNPDTVADITQLAPNQCLLLTADSPSSGSPDECDIIAQRDLSASVAFWLADFEVESATDGQRHTCPAAVPDKRIVCLMPR